MMHWGQAKRRMALKLLSEAEEMCSAGLGFLRSALGQVVPRHFYDVLAGFDTDLYRPRDPEAAREGRVRVLSFPSLPRAPGAIPASRHAVARSGRLVAVSVATGPAWRLVGAPLISMIMFPFPAIPASPPRAEGPSFRCSWLCLLSPRRVGCGEGCCRRASRAQPAWSRGGTGQQGSCDDAGGGGADAGRLPLPQSRPVRRGSSCPRGGARVGDYSGALLLCDRGRPQPAG